MGQMQYTCHWQSQDLGKWEEAVHGQGQFEGIFQDST